jgi:hypothetical protein
MGWSYADVCALPYDVYCVLVEELEAEAQRGALVAPDR